MVVELCFEIAVRKYFMNGIFHIPHALIEPGVDPFLHLNGRQAEHDPDEDDSNGDFDDSAQIQIIPLELNTVSGLA